VGEAGAAAGDQIDVAGQVELADLYFFIQPRSISQATHMRGTMATPMPFARSV